MKILEIIASPRKNGNTAIIAEKMSNRFKEFEDVEIEQIFLSDMSLGLCKGCCACLVKGEEYCPNKDDRAIIEEKIISADAIIFLSPVYAMNMTALMKNFLDRFAFTMHRPRFFNQYTMIVAVTGSVGLKETINSIAQLKYSGFNIVQSFGIVAENPLINPSFTNKKTIEKIENEAEKFYKKILAKKPIRPSFETMMQFRMQRKTFAKLKDKAVCDWEYFNEKGWFNPDRKYFVEGARLGHTKNILAKLLAKTL